MDYQKTKKCRVRTWVLLFRCRLDGGRSEYELEVGCTKEKKELCPL